MWVVITTGCVVLFIIGHWCDQRDRGKLAEELRKNQEERRRRHHE